MTGEILTEVFVPGRSLTKGSWTFVTSKYAKAPEGRKTWARQIAAAVSAERHKRLGPAGARPYRGGVGVDLTFFLPPSLAKAGTMAPTGHQTGDIDKLTRLVLDALKTGGVYADDSQVLVLHVVKMWADATVPQGVAIEARELDAEPGGRWRAQTLLARRGLAEETGY